jgi:hypothetical protein
MRHFTGRIGAVPKGIQWFASGLIFGHNPDGTLVLTRAGEDIKAINADLRALGPTLVRLKSVGVFHTEPVRAEREPKPPQQRKARSRPVQVEPGITLKGEYITLGSFKDEEGRRYALIANRDIERIRQATLRLDPGIIGIASFDTTRKEWIPAQPKNRFWGKKTLVVDLQPGDGVLLEFRSKGQ